MTKKKTRMLWLVLACLLALYKYVHASYTPLNILHGPQAGGALIHPWDGGLDVSGIAPVSG
ncbi:hypothetical protein [Dyella flagellata]|uniref:hypothetical protein n=1 Tax=Dyella flagellata TaxID=1867833 RepID=UPI0024E0DC67|nr:hypothetical protein [Dyella flagellata]